MATTKVRAVVRDGAPAERLLNVHDAAAILAVKPETLYQWAYQRRIPVVKLFGHRGALRFREADIRALITRSVRPALRSAAEPGGLDL
jgi:predicted DNA-binding transcriptional regulator AlpA